jgi:hypothetical protein
LPATAGANKLDKESFIRTIKALARKHGHEMFYAIPFVLQSGHLQQQTLAESLHTLIQQQTLADSLHLKIVMTLSQSSQEQGM